MSDGLPESSATKRRSIDREVWCVESMAGAPTPVVPAGAGGDLARVVAGDSLGVIANRLGRLCRRSVGRWLVTAAGYGIERSERHGSGLAGRSGAALR